jgi:hypothetical protein
MTAEEVKIIGQDNRSCWLFWRKFFFRPAPSRYAIVRRKQNAPAVAEDDMPASSVMPGPKALGLSRALVQYTSVVTSTFFTTAQRAPITPNATKPETPAGINDARPALVALRASVLAPDEVSVGTEVAVAQVI